MSEKRDDQIDTGKETTAGKIIEIMKNVSFCVAQQVAYNNFPLSVEAHGYGLLFIYSDKSKFIINFQTRQCSMD